MSTTGTGVAAVKASSEVDVLIIGAGPAGLMCAFALARAGITNIRIVDQRPKKVAAGQADGIQPRTTEVFKVCKVFWLFWNVVWTVDDCYRFSFIPRVTASLIDC
ncbi:hypothetical protein F5050DRAFT_1063101 [Lentinula boryana]|uniref:FAD-binding domain-containing protein n=1 Tax=Lentinula boryana TaxID=40481 RepID=A0ABQ8PZI4_9AGAR|nr:hypothetical protein F5050DRAFT_1063101 [Lentinula boryana]